MITKNYIITKEGRKNGLCCLNIFRDINHIVCATEYDIYGQSSLYANNYFKDNQLVGVCISANTEKEIDNYVKQWVEWSYLMEDKK